MLIFIWTIKINTCKLPIQEFWDNENLFNFKLDVDLEFSQASSQKGTINSFRVLAREGFLQKKRDHYVVKAVVRMQKRTLLHLHARPVCETKILSPMKNSIATCFKNDP